MTYTQFKLKYPEIYKLVGEIYDGFPEIFDIDDDHNTVNITLTGWGGLSRDEIKKLMANERFSDVTIDDSAGNEPDICLTFDLS